jgi:hypothetical protein
MNDISTTFSVGDLVSVKWTEGWFIRCVVLAEPSNGKVLVDTGFQDEYLVPLKNVTPFRTLIEKARDRKM